MKAKKTFLKIAKLFMCFMMIFTLISKNASEVKAAASIYPYNPNAVIPAEYYNQYTGYKTDEMTMSSHFILTPPEGVGNISASGMKYYVPESALKNANNFGKIWWQYNNVMTVKNQKVHIRFTALSWNNTSLRYGYLGIRTKGTIGAFTPRNTRVRVQFINASTGQPISVKTSLTGRDFDSATSSGDIEKMTIHSGIDRVYLGEWMTNSGQTIWNAHGDNVTADEKRAWATFCISGSSFEYTYTKGGQLVFYKGDGVAPVEKRYKITTKSTNATITQTQTEIIKGQSRTISWTAKDGYFISSVKVDGVSQPISSYRTGTYTFSNIQADHTVEVVATAQYHITTQGTNATITEPIYNIDPSSTKTVSWNAKDGYWVSSVLVDGVPQTVNSYRSGSYTFKNIHENHDIKVVANPCYTITTEVVNGNITGNQTKIDPNENRTIDFSPKNGYYVSEVIVDGHAYSYKDYAQSYTFKNIHENHHIKVVCEPLKTITTEITNGVITKTMTGLHPDDIKDIYYNAFYEYYIESVVVDGKNITVDDFVEGNYEFDPVITDHFIKVVCQPKPRITTEIVNGNITPEFTVFPHEDGKTIAQANDGYYISRVLVDGKEVKDFGEYKNVYTFKDVTENHHIYVECNPMPTLSLQKATDKESYNYKDVVKYTVTLKQTRENAIAYNVFLRDSDLTEGVKIDMDSLKVNGLDENQYTFQKNVDDFELTIDELNHNQTVTVSFDGTVLDKNLVNKNIENHVYATADHFNEQVHDSVVNKILKPKLSIEKATDREKYNAYDEIQYDITVSQTVEGAKAFNVNVSDIFPQGVDVALDSFVIDGVDGDGYTLTKDKEGFNLVINELSDDDIVVSYLGHIADPTLAGKTITNTARATSETNTKEVTSSVTNEIYKPQLVLSKTSDKDYYNVEDEAIFTIALAQSVQNAIAYNIVLTDTDISNGVDIDWKSLQISGLEDDKYAIEKFKDRNGFELRIKELHSDDVVNITYTARINDNSLAGSEVTNSVNATCDNNTDIIKATVTKPILKPEFTIEKESNHTDYNVGDELEFVLKVNQTKENAIANHVIIRDFDLSRGIQLDLNSIQIEGIDETLYTIKRDNDNNTFNVEINALAFNQEVIIRVKGQVTEPTLAGQTITNSASVSASNNNKVVTDNVTAHIYKPELSIEKTSDKPTYNYQEDITYTIKVNQTVDGAKANDVVLKDELPEGLELDMNSFIFEGIKSEEVKVEKTDKGYMATLPTLVKEVTVTYKAKVIEPSLSGTTITNKAIVSASNNPLEIKTTCDASVLKPTFTLEKASEKAPFNYNDLIKYTIRVNMTTTDAIAYNVVLKDELPEGLELDINSFIFEGIEAEKVKIEKTDKGFKLIIAKLSHPFMFTYNAKVSEPSLSGQDITNRVSISCINNPEVIKAQKVDTILKPSLAIEKTSDKPSYNYQDDITYKIKVSQTTENAKAYNVVLKDELPEGLELDINSFIFEGIEAEKVKIEKTDKGYMAILPTLEKEVTVTYKTTVIEPSLSGTTITNYVSVTSSNSFNTVEDTCDVDILKPVFEISKTSDKEFYNINDTIHYTVNAKQVVEGAKAYKVVLNDANLNKGLKINQDSIVVNGLDEADYDIERKPQGYLLLHLDYMSDEELQIDYDAKVVNPKLAGQKINHEVSISCINNPEIAKWEDSIENVVLKPEFTMSKTANVSKVKLNDTIQYDVTINQTVDNAIAYDVMFNDQLETNQRLNPESVQVHSNNLEKDDYTIEMNDNGFNIVFKVIDFKEPIHIQYDAKVINDDKQSTYNIAWIECPQMDRVVTQTKIDIYKESVVDESVKTDDQHNLYVLGLLGIASGLGIYKLGKKNKED